LFCWPQRNEIGLALPPAGGFRKLSVGPTHGCALTTGGRARCWGNPNDGRVSAPRRRFDQIAVGDAHSCGLTRRGRAICWGADQVDQARPPADHLISIAAAGDTTCGLTKHHRAVCWGTLGYVIPRARYRQISPGGRSGCGLTPAGSITCWGSSSAWLPARAGVTDPDAQSPVAVRKCLELQGPATVDPGAAISLTQSGYQAGQLVQVIVGPVQFGDATAHMQVIRQRMRIGQGGRMVLRFHFPAHDVLNFGDGHPIENPWADGQLAYVSAAVNQPSATGNACAYKQVTIRTAQ
jgi:hypothetical protein